VRLGRLDLKSIHTSVCRISWDFDTVSLANGSLDARDLIKAADTSHPRGGTTASAFRYALDGKSQTGSQKVET